MDKIKAKSKPDIITIEIFLVYQRPHDAVFFGELHCTIGCLLCHSLMRFKLYSAMISNCMIIERNNKLFIQTFTKIILILTLSIFPHPSYPKRCIG